MGMKDINVPIPERIVSKNGESSISIGVLLEADTRQPDARP